ncbi:MAG: DUF5711 family protein [Firmicutes bacterium]|nr:DUF5711 family protein [Bacillota bacterium]
MKYDKKKVIKISAGIFILLLVMGTLLLYTKNDTFRGFFDRYVFRKEVYANNLPNIPIDEVDLSHIYAFGGSIFVLEQNSLKSYNKLGYEEYSLDVEIANPIFDSSGNYLCLADKNSKKVYLISERNIVWQKDMSGNIINICVNRNGYIAATTRDVSDKSIITTYDNNGNVLFKTHISTTSIIAVNLSDDNKYLALAEADSSGIMVQSDIQVISVQNAEKLYTYMAKPGDLIVNIKYNNKNKLICMYDSHMDSINNNQAAEITKFEDGTLFADINLDSNIIKVIKKMEGMFSAKSEMQIISSNDFNQKITYEAEDVPKTVNTYSNMAYLNFGTEVLFINTNGWLIKDYKSSEEVQGIALGDSVAGIIYKDRIEIISF